MNKDDIWKLFKITGNIDYYIKYKDMIDKGLDKLGNNEGKRDNNKWKTI